MRLSCLRKSLICYLGSFNVSKIKNFNILSDASSKNPPHTPQGRWPASHRTISRLRVGGLPMTLARRSEPLHLVHHKATNSELTMTQPPKNLNGTFFWRGSWILIWGGAVGMGLLSLTPSALWADPSKLGSIVEATLRLSLRLWRGSASRETHPSAPDTQEGSQKRHLHQAIAGLSPRGDPYTPEQLQEIARFLNENPEILSLKIQPIVIKMSTLNWIFDPRSVPHKRTAPTLSALFFQRLLFLRRPTPQPRSAIP